MVVGSGGSGGSGRSGVGVVVGGWELAGVVGSDAGAGF